LKLDRLGRNLRHLVNTLHDRMERGICFRVLTGQGANIDTTTASGRFVFGIFAALAEFERELIRERTIAGLSSARARGRNGGRPYTMTSDKRRLAQAAMAKRDTKVSDLCTELGVTRQTLYRFVGPKGSCEPTPRSCSSARGRTSAHEGVQDHNRFLISRQTWSPCDPKEILVGRCMRSDDGHFEGFQDDS